MINVLFAGNCKVFDGILTCILSILKRTATKEPFCFCIYTMDVSHIKPEYKPVSERQAEFLQKVVLDYNPENTVRKIDVTELYNEYFSGCPNESAYCSPYTLIRLFADIIHKDVDKLLYLDADILFNRDIRLLYDIDISDVEYAAARDHYGKYLVRYNYINAGVLLLNLDLIRKNDCFARAREILREKKQMFADQSALIKATTKRKVLPQKFNDQKFLHDHTVIRHFSQRLFWLPYPHIENVKQWQVSRIHKTFGYYRFDDILYEYIYLNRKFENQESE